MIIMIMAQWIEYNENHCDSQLINRNKLQLFWKQISKIKEYDHNKFVMSRNIILR